MDPDVLSVGAILAGIFGAVIVFIWQINSQSSRLETKIEDQGKELRSEIETQGRELRTEIETQGKELRAEMENHVKELKSEIAVQGRRVSDSELEQARLNGINSVLVDQTHTHEYTAD